MHKRLLCCFIACLMALSLNPVLAASSEPLVLHGIKIAPDDVSVAFPNVTEITAQEVSDLLTHFPNLREVDLYEAPLQREAMLKLVTDFPQVKFGFSFVLADKEVRSDRESFSTMNKKRQFGNAEFEYLKLFKNLKALDIGHNRVDDLSILYSLPQLRILIVACNRLVDITPIGSLKDLEYCEVFDNQIKDISPLASCENLIDLNLCFNRIKNLSPVLGLKKLNRLWVYSCLTRDANTVDPTMRETLAKTLPDCHVDYYSHRGTSTGGGWRKHPRYFTMYEVFTSGIYRPFDPEPAKQ